MKFRDLKFGATSADGTRSAYHKIADGMYIHVLISKDSRGGDQGLYEAAVLRDDYAYNIKGWLSEADVERYFEDVVTSLAEDYSSDGISQELSSDQYQSLIDVLLETILDTREKLDNLTELYADRENDLLHEYTLRMEAEKLIDDIRYSLCIGPQDDALEEIYALVKRLEECK